MHYTPSRKGSGDFLGKSHGLALFTLNFFYRVGLTAWVTLTVISMNIWEDILSYGLLGGFPACVMLAWALTKIKNGLSLRLSGCNFIWAIVASPICVVISYILYKNGINLSSPAGQFQYLNVSIILIGWISSLTYIILIKRI